jgi:peroxiredoxin
MSTLPPDPPALLPAGTPAPDFRLRGAPDRVVALRDLRGRPVVLVFYPGDWRPVCRDQLTLYQEFLPELARLGAVVVGISVDSVWSHEAFAYAQRLEFPLLADYEPRGQVARAYGVYREADGTSERALFVLDAAGVIRWSYVAPPNVNPGVDGVLTALEALAAQPAPAAAPELKAADG